MLWRIPLSAVARPRPGRGARIAGVRNRRVPPAHTRQSDRFQRPRCSACNPDPRRRGLRAVSAHLQANRPSGIGLSSFRLSIWFPCVSKAVPFSHSSGGNNGYITPRDSLLQTILDADLEFLSEPERPHPQRIERDFEAIGQSLPVFDLCALLSLIVLKYQLAVLRRKASEAPLQTIDARFQLFKLVWAPIRIGQFTERLAFFGAFFMDFQQQHSRSAEEIACGVADLFSFGDPFRNSIDRLIGVIFRKRTAAPLEETDQVAANLQVFFSGAFRIGAKRDEQLIERFLC